MVVVVGETVIVEPVPAVVPAQFTLYQRQLAPVPRFPPLMLSVVFPPRQIVLLPVIEVAGTELS